MDLRGATIKIDHLVCFHFLPLHQALFGLLHKFGNLLIFICAGVALFTRNACKFCAVTADDCKQFFNLVVQMFTNTIMSE